uniref:Putative secreted protein n=1 Tax=Ixodes ricinus TaxID=34613 RepID=A0A6B0TVV0_IXORI
MVGSLGLACVDLAWLVLNWPMPAFPCDALHFCGVLFSMRRTNTNTIKKLFVFYFPHSRGPIANKFPPTPPLLFPPNLLH